ncbi:chromosomal replication initiator protein DnaA [Desulfococcaceae bacterium HSG7]|nr:chromosomal replication initiator protein DnaA [Desulfococcaceae bacterium HSG7]
MKTDLKNTEMTWTKVKTVIKQRIALQSYQMWIEPLEFVSNDPSGFVLSTPNLYSKKRILSNYKHVIETEIKNIIGQTCKLKIDVAEGKPVSKAKFKVETQRRLPFDDKKSNLYGGRQLQRNFTFDQFVVGDNNNFAYSAALALASRKSTYQNALFLFSDIGLGKSHLSQSIGHHIMAKYPDERVFYITAEDFTNEMVFAFKNGAIDRFKQKYRNNCDVLLLEDVHHLSGKERTQIELALTLDTLFEAQKKIIFSSCHLPADIPKLSDKLKSRLTSGLISTIEPPNFRTRVRILNKKSQLNGYKIPPDITRYLASELITDIRQLESGLTGVAAKSLLMGKPIDFSLAESVVCTIADKRKSITVDAIKKMVCRKYNISKAEIESKSRKMSVVRPRQIAMYLARNYTDATLQVIGRSFKRYHATVLHSIGTVEKGLKTNRILREQIKYLRQKLDTEEF